MILFTEPEQIGTLRDHQESHLEQTNETSHSAILVHASFVVLLLFLYSIL